MKQANIKQLDKIAKTLSADKSIGKGLSREEIKAVAKRKLNETEIQYISAMFLKLKGNSKAQVTNPYFTDSIKDLVWGS